MRIASALLLGLFVATSVHAEVQTKNIEYSDGAVALEGDVAWDPDSAAADAPGVLVVHQ